MPRFRAGDPTSSLIGKPLELDAVRRLLADVMAPRHFFLGTTTTLQWRHDRAEECSWHVFQGRLLDPAHTRQRMIFESWNAYLVQDGVASAEPLLSLKLDAYGALVHVVRGLDSYIREGYDSGGGVFLSRERRKWVRELSTTVELKRLADLDELRDEMICALFHAVVGTSRLPLSSVEAPLPAFSFGELFYCYCPGEQLLFEDLPLEGLHPLERVKWLETMLHRLPANDVDRAAEILWQRGGDWLTLLRQMFNEVSLSPWTNLVENTIAIADAWLRSGRLTASALLDFLRALLCQIGRHLTAYDLTTYHYRGANYPDALLLDVVLQRFLRLAQDQPELLTGVDKERRLRRRALRQAWLLRRLYEGHPVPDAPTSPGENQRVLPAGHPRVAEEQILQPAKRTRRLYDSSPLADLLGLAGVELLRMSVRDLEHPDERRELGLALYLDRPLGDAKANAEPDRTPLLSSLAFSQSIARQRLLALRHEPLLQAEASCLAACLADAFSLPGVPVDQIGAARCAAVVSLADAGRVASDFAFLRTTTSTLKDLQELFDFQPVLARFGLDWKGGLVARSLGGDSLLIYDKAHRPWLEFVVDAANGYAVRANKEFPVNGLVVLRVWAGEPARLRDLTTQPIRIMPNV